MCNLSRAHGCRQLAQRGTPWREEGKSAERGPIADILTRFRHLGVFYSTKFTGSDVEYSRCFEFRSLRLPGNLLSKETLTVLFTGKGGLHQLCSNLNFISMHGTSACFSKRTFGVRVWLPVRGSRKGYSTVRVYRGTHSLFSGTAACAIFRARWVARRKRCGLQGVAAQLEGSVCSFRSSCSYSRYWFYSRQRGQRSHSLVRNPRKPFASCLMRSQQGS